MSSKESGSGGRAGTSATSVGKVLKVEANGQHLGWKVNEGALSVEIY